VTGNMNKGLREKIKQFILVIFFMSIVMLLMKFQALPGWLLQVLVIAVMVHMLLFFFGVFIGKGPFKYIAELYVSDDREKRELLRSKQPWE
jgi:Flp pilus assembly protein protease CpaA